MKDFLAGLRAKFMNFMVGRYGTDQLNSFLLAASVVLILLGSILKNSALGSLFSVLAITGIVFADFRMFSRNLAKRSSENGKYMQLKYKVLAKIRVLKEKWVQRKDYKFFTCPSCHTTLRVPRGKGKIRIVCRKCGNSFSGKT